jgi:hypothetical protein
MKNAETNVAKRFNYSFHFINNLAGWMVFLLATITYLLTIEPTTSFWDCGEFIASAHKLEVGHPPGAPFFIMSAKVFSLLAGGDVTKVAMMVNAFSALASSFTILFLFWTISYFAQKIVDKPKPEYNVENYIAVIGSSAVGALAYTFSDTFWFSAVEGEVYALSSLFTAVVFWAILKWELVSDEKYANRWLILIAYLMGLSIGVHLLNLLAIPAIVFVYYFKKYPATNRGILVASLVAVLILGLVMYGIIPWVVKIASIFELIAVNEFGMPFKSGVLIYMGILLALISWGIYFTRKYGHVLLNTILVSFTVIVIGYSSYSMIVIRAIADPPMNENNPSDVFSLLSYLNREQYGNRPLFYGQYFNAKITEIEYDSTYTQKEGKYVKIPATNPTYSYDSEFSTLFPRMYSRSSSHINAYQSWASISDKNKKPTFVQNMAFFFGYQLNHMYIRYFMWNFAGRQNDEQGHGGILKGNWISGIPFVDAIRLGPQSDLPESMTANKGRNKYYLLPLILGLLGLIFTFQKQPRQFVIIFLLFFFTGIAIVIYLNQTPYQPRERDYAYAGSFYAFAVWIGLGVMVVTDWLKKISKPVLATSLATLLCLVLVPVNMAKENWDDHDRSGRYTARDLAKNYLRSCAPGAILFTYGDNDTFPLWYVQEVEGFRTDVRVVNLSLLSTDWYISQMKKKAYGSEPVPFSFTPEKYQQGTRDIVYVVEKFTDTIPLKDAMRFVASDNMDTRIRTEDNRLWDYLPATNLSVPVDSLVVFKNGILKPEMANSMVHNMVFSVSGKYLHKNAMMVLDLVSNFNWERPVYFALSIGEENYMDLQDYFRLEGFAYRLVPVKRTSSDAQIGYIDTDILYHNLMNTFEWGRMEQPDVLMDQHNLRVLSILRVREIFSRLAHELILEGKKEKAVSVLDRIVEIMPENQVPYDFQMIPIAEAYYLTGQPDKANAIVWRMYQIFSSNVKYYLALRDNLAIYTILETRNGIAYMQKLREIAEENGQKKLVDDINKTYTGIIEKFEHSVQNR